MRYTIVTGNKPSQVALHQNHTILVFIEMLEYNVKYLFFINHNMPNIKWDKFILPDLMDIP